MLYDILCIHVYAICHMIYVYVRHWASLLDLLLDDGLLALDDLLDDLRLDHLESILIIIIIIIIIILNNNSYNSYY